MGCGSIWPVEAVYGLWSLYLWHANLNDTFQPQEMYKEGRMMYIAHKCTERNVSRWASQAAHSPQCAALLACVWPLPHLLPSE